MKKIYWLIIVIVTLFSSYLFSVTYYPDNSFVFLIGFAFSIILFPILISLLIALVYKLLKFEFSKKHFKYTFSIVWLIVLLFNFIAFNTGLISTDTINNYKNVENLPLSEHINILIDTNKYEAALNRLSEEDRDDPEVLLLLEKTHLNYALHSMTTFDQTEMRTRMNNALVQFTEVLRINPNNVVAREQIEQILAIYQTFPNRAPDPSVMEGLREFGYE